MMVIIQQMFLTSCVSTPKTEIVHEVVVPELTFPEFPLSDSIEYVGSNRVEGDLDWFTDLAIFLIKYRELMADYNEIKALYEARNEQHEIDAIH